MKTKLLIFGLFICSLGFGQESEIFHRLKLSDGNYILLPEKEFDILLGNDLIKINHYEDVLMISDKARPHNNDMIFLMTKYSEECYNDSILVNVPYMCPKVGCLVNHVGYKEYQHMHPTFEGFIEWINNH